ncbi:MAG: Os1348 family NHLP clan protein [Rudaea sp.]
MSTAVFEQVIGKMLIDPDFLDQVQADRAAAFRGFDLTPEERQVLAALDPRAFSAAAEILFRNSQLTPSSADMVKKLTPIVKRLGLDMVLKMPPEEKQPEK